MANLDKYPTIKRWVLEVALSNGMINRLEPEALTLQKAEQALFADGIPEQDVQALENWMSGLDIGQLDTIADGEQTEMDVILAQAPNGCEGHPVSKLLDDIFEF